VSLSSVKRITGAIALFIAEWRGTASLTMFDDKRTRAWAEDITPADMGAQGDVRHLAGRESRDGSGAISAMIGR